MPGVAALDCRFEHVPGSIRLYTPAPVPPSQVGHEKLAGSYVLMRAGRTTEGRFSGTRHNDYGDLSLTLDNGGWLSTPYSYHWLARPEQANGEPVHGSVSFDQEAPTSMSCTGPLAQGP